MWPNEYAHAKYLQIKKNIQQKFEENPYKFLQLNMRLITFSLTKKSPQKTMESSSLFILQDLCSLLNLKT